MTVFQNLDLLSGNLFAAAQNFDSVPPDIDSLSHNSDLVSQKSCV